MTDHSLIIGLIDSRLALQQAEVTRALQVVANAITEIRNDVEVLKSEAHHRKEQEEAHRREQERLRTEALERKLKEADEKIAALTEGAE